MKDCRAHTARRRPGAAIARNLAGALAALGLLLLAGCSSERSQGEHVSPSVKNPHLPAAAAMAAGATSTSAMPAHSGDSSRVRLLTYNVLASPVFLEMREPAVIEILRRSNADVLALQEVTQSFADKLAAAPWVRERYSMTMHEGRAFAPGGQLLMARHRAADTQVLRLVGQQRRVALFARFEIHGHTLVVGTSHLESFLEDGPVRAKQLEQIFDVLASAPNAALMGDLNFGDSEQPETGLLDPRYRDPWPLLRTAEPGHTWNMPENPLAAIGAFSKERNRRLDRILLRAAWTPVGIELIGNTSVGTARLGPSDVAQLVPPDRVQDAPLGQEIQVFPSDHYGLIADFDIRAR